jgi:arabinogalactan oligomer / maltooligosaccharide transport system permease protein
VDKKTGSLTVADALLGQASPGARRAGPTLTITAKIALLGLVNALAVYGLVATFTLRDWGIFAFLAAATAAIDWIYLSRRRQVAKFLLPGTLFLLAFQVYLVLYTGWASFTNYGDGHLLTKEQALERILAVSERRVPGSPTYRIAVVDREGSLSLLITDAQGAVQLGDAGGVAPVEPGEVRLDGDGKAVALAGYRTLTLPELAQRQEEVLGLRVPLGDPGAGALRTEDGSSGYLARSTLAYDAAADRLTDSATGRTWTAGPDGFYAAADGEQLTPGWRVTVGVDNYARFIADARLRGPFLSVFVWTFAFAALSVLLNFALGLLLALTFDSRRMRGRGLYRALLVLPYAVPSFLSALVWTGMLNQSFGIVNQTLLGGASIPWLNDPWLAKASVLLVNLWLGFPYMFLIATGALQSIPTELREAARIDGASAFQHFRSITLPLLLVSTAPLLIAAFAFNFNNFTVIYFVTGGGPNIPEAPISLGSTDLLISMLYKLAFGASGRQWGFACALSMVIFAIVATISAISFRRTRSLEEVF